MSPVIEGNPEASMSATVTIGGKEFTVLFTIGTLIAIEERAGKTIGELVDDLQKASLQTSEGQEAPTQEQVADALRRFKVGPAVSFIAACTGATKEEINDGLPLSDLKAAFWRLGMGLADAFGELNGAKRGSDSTVPSPAGSEAPAASAPGDASNSG